MQHVNGNLPIFLFIYSFRPQHFLYFLPLPQGQGSFLPTLGSSLVTVAALPVGKGLLGSGKPLPLLEYVLTLVPSSLVELGELVVG